MKRLSCLLFVLLISGCASISARSGLLVVVGEKGIIGPKGTVLKMSEWNKKDTVKFKKVLITPEKVEVETWPKDIKITN